ncbi:Fc.00g035720.m01.CDS01 [Cosmosporella sp. VM-42]
MSPMEVSIRSGYDVPIVDFHFLQSPGIILNTYAIILCGLVENYNGYLRPGGSVCTEPLKAPCGRAAHAADQPQNCKGVEMDSGVKIAMYEKRSQLLDFIPILAF